MGSGQRKKSILKILETEILPFLPIHISEMIKKVPENNLINLEEIRLRANMPLMLVKGNDDFMITPDGKLINYPSEAYITSKEDIFQTFQFISQYSVYSFEEELKNGFITVAGGHRIGFAGHVLLENEHIKTIKYISGFNIRIAREVIGTADKVLPYIVQNGKVLNVLIVSPPKAGKTTLLRDLVRQLSSGVENLGIKGQNVGLVDERSEIACCYEGIPQNNIGLRTDVLDGCPKAKGIMMLLRSMSPDIIATDEIGKIEDVMAIEEAINTGVTIITTVHGSNLNDLRKRPTIKNLLSKGFFQRFIILSNSKGAGTVEAILEGNNFKDIFQKE